MQNVSGGPRVVSAGAMLVNLGGAACAVAVVFVLAAPPAHARALQADAVQIQSLYQQGERALSEQRYADAEQAYERLRQLQPGRAEVHARLGLIYFQQGRFADALPPLRRALALKPALPNATKRRWPGTRRRSTNRQRTPPSVVWRAFICSGPTQTSIVTARPSPWLSN